MSSARTVLDVDALVAAVDPDVIVHLAAVIPPPRFVHASSIAVCGARNPHRNDGLVSDWTPVSPSDLYGAHKAEAEAIVTASGLDWVILRLGGVIGVDMGASLNLDHVAFDNLIPVDNRIHTIDVREVFLIAGDDSHRQCHGDVAPAMAAAPGLPGVIPTGRKGNPESAIDWFATDWMDTERSERVLSFQHHSVPDILAEVSAKTGWKRCPARLIAPIVRVALRRRSAYRGGPGQFADTWGAVRP